MDKKLILSRIDQLMAEKNITNYKLKENAEISTTIYQWRKNAKRDEARTPSLKSIEKICNYFNVSLSYFFAFDNESQRKIKNLELLYLIENLTEEQINIIILLVKQLNQ